MEAEGIVFDIRRFSIHDGPGIRTTEFLKGCPLRCRWCHNPEGLNPGLEMMFWPRRCLGCGACLLACPQGAISQNGSTVSTDRSKCTLCGECVAVCYAEARQIVGRRMSVAQVMAEVARDLPFYDESGGGVTLSGGEPLAQPDFVRALLRACKKKGIHTALDTCGFAAWEVLDSIREYVDLFLYDLKLMDDARHRQCTGVSNALILSNLQALSRCGHAIVIRIPLIPGINDDEDNLRQTGVFAAALPHLLRVDLLPYHSMSSDKYSRLDMTYPLPATRPPSAERVAEIAQMLREFGLEVTAR
ncbi:MAG: glycyl-radical enzyme activating protein [Anaerolineae bacterium]|nr:glycyl-radical enzyme activating protein [Anaerolineae bacterium]